MMKTKVAMAISLAGVLAAGTAAALVNTRVLNGGSSSSLSNGALHTSGSSPEDVISPTVSTPIVSIPADPAAASPTQATYSIGDSGTVTLDTAGDVLTIVAAAPAAGWTIAQSETDDGNNAEVKFESGSLEVEFHANLVYGVVRTSVESHDQSTTGDSVGSSDSVSGSSESEDDEINGDDSGQGSDDDRGGGDD